MVKNTWTPALGLPRMDPGQAAAPQNWLEMQICGPHLRPTEPAALRMGLVQKSVPKEPPGNAGIHPSERTRGP